MDNYISIIAMQDSALAVEQITAFFMTPYMYFYEKEPIQLEVERKYGKFKIHPDSLGSVEFQVKLRGTTEIVRIRAEPIKAVCRLSKHKANSEAKISVAEFKAQLGLSAYVECCGFEASCKMIEFEILRIANNNHATRVMNRGGRFEETSLRLIKQAGSGDIYIFRNIYYQCPSTENQRSEDMIFEIR